MLSPFRSPLTCFLALYAIAVTHFQLSDASPFTRKAMNTDAKCGTMATFLSYNGWLMLEAEKCHASNWAKSMYEASVADISDPFIDLLAQFKGQPVFTVTSLRLDKTSIDGVMVYLADGKCHPDSEGSGYIAKVDETGASLTMYRTRNQTCVGEVDPESRKVDSSSERDGLQFPMVNAVDSRQQDYVRVYNAKGQVLCFGAKDTGGNASEFFSQFLTVQTCAAPPASAKSNGTSLTDGSNNSTPGSTVPNVSASGNTTGDSSAPPKDKKSAANSQMVAVVSVILLLVANTLIM